MTSPQPKMTQNSDNHNGSPTGALRAGLATIASASAAPYGYTITVWSSGALLMHSHGAPAVGDVFLFALGALVGFGVLGLLASGPLSGSRPIERGTDRVVAGMLDWAAVGASLGAVALIAQIHGAIAWPLGSLAATLIFLVAAGVQLAVSAGARTTK